MAPKLKWLADEQLASKAGLPVSDLGDEAAEVPEADEATEFAETHDERPGFEGAARVGSAAPAKT